MLEEKVVDRLESPLWKLCGKDLIQIFEIYEQKKAADSIESKSESSLDGSNTDDIPSVVYGLSGIASLFGCSIKTASRIKESGVINEAISQIGRQIIVDSRLALKLTNVKNRRRKKQC